MAPSKSENFSPFGPLMCVPWRSSFGVPSAYSVGTSFSFWAKMPNDFIRSLASDSRMASRLILSGV